MDSLKVECLNNFNELLSTNSYSQYGDSEGFAQAILDVVSILDDQDLIDWVADDVAYSDGDIEALEDVVLHYMTLIRNVY